MINLIPKEEKNKMVRFFYYKILVLVLTMLGLICFLFFVSILPTYFLSSIKNSIISTKLENQKVEPVLLPNQQTLDTISDIDNKLNIIELAEKNQFTVSNNIINAVILKKAPNIKITDISYKNDVSGNKKISIEGVAPSREALLLFRRTLEDDIAFKQIDLPISNFIKGSNIRFYLSIIPS